jgi:indole-3-glycerol phosphate synthase
VATYLDDILAAHRARAAADGRPFERVVEQARRAAPVRDFARALRRTDRGIAVIAEIKRRSPSKGALAPDLVPGLLAKQYADGGAAALSVLTDEDHFGGSAADLVEARSSVDLPVLRKDFTVSALDVADARFMGADAVLLIVAALDDAELRDLHTLATGDLGLAALVEAHDEREVERAVEAGATIIGVNQRDLVTFEVDTDRATRVAATIPDSVIKVAESGIRDAGDAKRLAEAGYDAILVGEHLVTTTDPALAVRQLVAACS